MLAPVAGPDFSESPSARGAKSLSAEGIVQRRLWAHSRNTATSAVKKQDVLVHPTHRRGAGTALGQVHFYPGFIRGIPKDSSELPHMKQCCDYRVCVWLGKDVGVLDRRRKANARRRSPDHWQSSTITG